jgi:4-diphosphocytidyl-2-C-methyl-D-erythritol kinase
MQTISLRDELRFQLAPTSDPPVAVIRSVRAGDRRVSLDNHGLLDESNLIVRALRLLREGEAPRSLCRIEVELLKYIPPASGLGGASSDAAAALVAGCQLWDLGLAPVTLAHLARRLGADVPFFLRGGTALASGIGERLEQLPDLEDAWFVVVFPLRMVPIPQKTASLYRAITPGDWTTGEGVESLADRIRMRQPFDADLLRNAFARPLYDLRPELRDLVAAMKGAGASCVALSGAGPTHYTIERDPSRARSVAEALRARLGDEALVQVVTPVAAKRTFTGDVH